ncbi:hypothetical protein DFH06DRAFT_1229786 [Mycena polygramma]|nr:hypothetical protein DFH06DRAFT_1229786 [Mycena polygramma]
MSVVYPTAISFLSSNVTFIRACLFILSGGSQMALAFLPNTVSFWVIPSSAGSFVARRGPSRRDAGLERLEIRGETTRYVPCPVFRVAQRTVLQASRNLYNEDAKRVPWGITGQSPPEIADSEHYL